MSITPNKNLYEYLEKYLYALDSVKSISQEKASTRVLSADILHIQEKKPIWQLCWQGVDTAPDLVKKCMASVKKYHSDRLILIDESNYTDFIEIPDFIFQKFQNRLMKHAHLSDYIRLALLAKYGGTWIDITVFLSAPLPDSLLSQDFYLIKFPHWKNLDEIVKTVPRPLFDIIDDKRFLFRSAVNWFIHSFPNNPIILGTKALLEAYWKEENQLLHYFLFHAFFSMTVLHTQENRELYNNINFVFSPEECHLLQYFLPKEFSQNVLSQIYAKTAIHKLTYKYLFNVNNENSFLQYILRPLN